MEQIDFQTTNSQSSVRKQNLNLWLISVCIATLSMMGIVSYIFLNRPQVNLAQNNSSSINNHIDTKTKPSDMPNPTLGLMSEWKTLNNTEDGYRIKYPNNWLDKGEINSTDGFYEHVLMSEDTDWDKPSSNGVYVFIRKRTKELPYGNNQRLTPKEYFERYKIDWSKAERVKVDNQPALFLTREVPTIPGEKQKFNFVGSYMILDNNKSLLELSYSSANYDIAKENLSVFKQIVNSMKFLN